MDISIVYLVLGLFLLFLAGAFVFREERRGGYLLLSGFVLLVLLGLLVLTTGLTYATGYTITTSGSTSTVNTVYASISALENTLVSMPLILVGVWGAIVTSLALTDRSDPEMADEE